MDTEKFITEIKKYIDAEVEERVIKERTLILTAVKKIIKKNDNHSNVSEQNERSDSLLDITKPDVNKTNTKKKNPSFNGAFSDLLNETSDKGEWRNINSNGMFTSQDAMGFGAMRGGETLMTNTDGLSQKTVNIPTTDPDGKPMNVSNLQNTDAGQAVINALGKNYSGLLKKSKEKSNRNVSIG